ncbi:MAG TPA: hypothetical protein DCQ06_09615 [Myxococcales bacterium]|nr:hypothetical protein [Myxococcales bacterium]HAN31841.1 hypothetical protein [Myxococcales bacterium]
MASFEWRGLQISADDDGRVTVTWPESTSALTASELVSLGEAIAAVGRLHGGALTREDADDLLARIRAAGEGSYPSSGAMSRRMSRRHSELSPQRITPRPTPVKQDGDSAQRKRAPKGHLLREIQTWMSSQTTPVSLKDIVQAAETGNWSEAQNIEPSLIAVLRRHSEVFIRTSDGNFTLRTNRPPGRVVRRRSVRQSTQSKS